ncbi:hypothetical protein J5N97_019031 [Dioscorea zingiberensis]|uniref:Uncharacterized protein n=1 Tax=Dioscorea zingiberensis TaxID=325984 RepID=A0A9D5HCB8_9LILI|nr:hypothetical protein J5N97_019031 [Dioscorea zingiberensis]
MPGSKVRMRSPTGKEVNWYETWSRRSSLRSGTRLLASVLSPKEETPSNTNQGSESDKSKDFSNNVAEKFELDYLEDDMDVDYRSFLKRLKLDGRSYAAELIIDGRPILLKYEREDDSCGDFIQSKPIRRSIVLRKEGSCAGIMKLKMDEEGSNSGLPPHSKHPSVGNGVKKTSLLDEDYQMFLNHVREDNGVMVFKMDNGGTIRYEEGVVDKEGRESSSKNEDMATEGSIDPSNMELQPFMGSSGSPDCEDDDLPFVFEDRLQDILKAPYDQNEYEELLKGASLRMPIIRYRQLRHRSSPYPTKELGFSYFDHYPDLADQIQQADRLEGLKLLRGFFFWLKNVSHEGAYMPWAGPRPKTMLTGGCSLALPLKIEMPND